MQEEGSRKKLGQDRVLTCGESWGKGVELVVSAEEGREVGEVTQLGGVGDTLERLSDAQRCLQGVAADKILLKKVLDKCWETRYM